GRSGDALDIELLKDRLALDPLEAEARDVRQAVGRVAGQYRAGDPLMNLGDQAAGEAADLGRTLAPGGQGQFERASHPHDGGKVLHPGPPAALTVVAGDQRLQEYPTASPEQPGALRPAELVSGDGEQIHPKFRNA